MRLTLLLLLLLACTSRDAAAREFSEKEEAEILRQALQWTAGKIDENTKEIDKIQEKMNRVTDKKSDAYLDLEHQYKIFDSERRYLINYLAYNEAHTGMQKLTAEIAEQLKKDNTQFASPEQNEKLKTYAERRDAAMEAMNKARGEYATLTGDWKVTPYRDALSYYQKKELEKTKRK